MQSGRRLLDTVTLSEVIKGHDAAVAARAVAYLSVHERFQFSIVTRFEILRGLQAKQAHRQIELSEKRCRTSTVLPLTDAIVIRAAEIYGFLHRKGSLIGDADVLIAATALEHELPLVTENTAHFRRVPGLVCESWRSA